MAHLPRGLLVLLTLWLVWSRPSAASRTESLHSAPWWETEEYVGYKKSAQEFRAAGNFRALENLYQEALAHAQSRHFIPAQISYLTALGNTATYLYQYADAVRSYAAARDLANSIGDWESAGAVAPGLASVHQQFGDWNAARSAVEEGLAATRHMALPPYYQPHLELQLARLSDGTAAANPAILRAIDGARVLAGTPADNVALDAVALEADGWDLLGKARLEQNDLAGAESAYLEAFRLRVLRAKRDLRLSYLRLGTLRLAQGRLNEAQTFTERAIYAEGSLQQELAAGALLHLRGQIREAQGRADEALADYELAAREAERWRLIAPPRARGAQAAADVFLHDQVLDSFVGAAAARAVWAGGEPWITKALAAVERNRAASLRHSQSLAPVWRDRLPAAYWKTLTELRVEESRQFALARPSEKIQRLHRTLGEMESAAGLGVTLNGSDEAAVEDTTRWIQGRLTDRQLLLSFYTGQQASYLWAVTTQGVNIYRLPGEAQLGVEVRQFAKAVRGRSAEAAALGEALYAVLFGQLRPTERAKQDWILSLEGPLFDLPFAALRAGGEYLVERHSLRSVPSALMLESRRTPQSDSFLGVGDAIYNSADERILHLGWRDLFLQPSRTGQLSRLVASATELQQSSSFWPQNAQLLTGDAANRATLLKQLNVLRPAVLHLATHVVNAAAAESYLALSVDASGRPELLGSSELATWNVPGSLVVMTGCASGVGEVLPGAGLLGLTRAWLSAGASGVLATSWPIEDTRGALLPAFYRQLSSDSAAEALRRGQVEMIHSGTWEADPAYWAAFHLTGGVR